MQKGSKEYFSAVNGVATHGIFKKQMSLDSMKGSKIDNRVCLSEMFPSISSLLKIRKEKCSYLDIFAPKDVNSVYYFI